MNGVIQWLRALGLDKYAQAFIDNEIDLENLAYLTEDDLKGIGIPLGPRKKLCNAISSLEEVPIDRPMAANRIPYIPTDDPAGAAERRLLTVMFCDLVASTSLAEQLDPEDLRQIILAYQYVCQQAIDRYDGYISRYVGDGLLVYFGFPHTHEDEAERAVRSALDILKAVHELETRQERPLQVRVGISSGLVVVGDVIGHGASREHTVIGETPNIAARLQGLADPDSILISAGTRKLLGDQFDYEDLGPQKLKGISELIRVWRVKGPRVFRNRFDATRSRELSPLVGRKPELDLLRERWRRAASGEGQMFLLGGEAGIGKSRIVESLQYQLGCDDPLSIYYQCSPHHVHSPLYPVVSHLEYATGLTADCDEEEKTERLERFLRQWSIPHDDVPLFKELLSMQVDPPLEMSPEEHRQRTLSAILRIFEMLAKDRPLLWIVEDAHWSDPTTQKLIGLVAERVSELRCLIVVTHRISFNASWLKLGHCTMLTLNRLGRDAATELTRSLTGGKELPMEVANQIIAKADGMPLFLEELTKDVLESGLVTDHNGRYVATTPSVSLAIPSTVQDLLMARLNRLDRGLKKVAQVASVFGGDFTRAMLESVSSFDAGELNEALCRLNESCILLQRGPPPPHSRYVFRRSLMRDAAYESLLRSERQRLHASIAALLERNYPDQPQVETEMLAYHYTQAGMADKAVTCCVLAGQRALDRSAYLEVVGFVEEGLDLLRYLDEAGARQQRELDLQLLQGAALRAVKGFASPQTKQSFTRAHDLCDGLDDPGRLIEVLRGLYSCHCSRGELVRAEELGRKVVGLGQKVNEKGVDTLGHWMLGCVEFWRGAFADARHYLEQASSSYESAGRRTETLVLQIDPGVNALFHLGWTLWILGYPDQALATSDRAIEVARELSHPFAVSMGLFFAIETRACAGYESGSDALLEELQTLSERYGFEYMRSCADVLEGQVLIARNQSEAGLQRIKRALTDFQEQEAVLGLPWTLAIVATACQQLGNREEGLATVAWALHIVDQNGERHWQAELHRLEGELLLTGTGQDAAQAERCFYRAKNLAREQGAKSLELRATMSLARLSSYRRDSMEVWRELAAVYHWFSEGGSSKDLQQARVLVESNGSN